MQTSKAGQGAELAAPLPPVVGIFFPRRLAPRLAQLLHQVQFAHLVAAAGGNLPDAYVMADAVAELKKSLARAGIEAPK